MSTDSHSPIYINQTLDNIDTTDKDLATLNKFSRMVANCPIYCRDSVINLLLGRDPEYIITTNEVITNFDPQEVSEVFSNITSNKIKHFRVLNYIIIRAAVVLEITDVEDNTYIKEYYIPYIAQALKIKRRDKKIY